MLRNQWLKLEISSGGLYIHFWSPCWLLWAPSQWSGPLACEVQKWFLLYVK